LGGGWESSGAAALGGGWLIRCGGGCEVRCDDTGGISTDVSPALASVFAAWAGRLAISSTSAWVIILTAGPSGRDQVVSLVTAW